MDDMSSSGLSLYTGIGANPLVVRLFIEEQPTISSRVKLVNVDIFNNENRKPPYSTLINPRGTLPALVVDINAQHRPPFVLTEVTAIIEFLDELSSSSGATSLFGFDPLTRAETRMWIRRADLEIATPLHTWYRNDPENLDFYKGHRGQPCPEARLSGKVMVHQALERLDVELSGRRWLCGDRFTAADVFLYGMVKLMVQVAPWVVLASRTEFIRWMGQMDERAGCKKILAEFAEGMKSG